ncbi:MAG: GNAT family N-acetyltransferase [Bacilli bacterium]
MKKNIVDNKELLQLELYFEDVLVGRVEYKMYNNYIDYTFIFVDPNYRGQKIALQLAEIAYSHNMESQLKANVSCGVLNKILKENEQFSNFNWL